MKVPCLKCGSPNTYSDGPEMACLMCGKRWPINGAKLIPIIANTGRKAMEAKPTSGKVGKCVNCEREKYIADKEGLCASCHHAVKGISKDSGAYAIALADAKKRLINNPSRRGRVKKAKATALPVKSAKQEAKTIAHRGINPITKALEDVRIPDDLIFSHDDIIKTLKAQRDFHLTQMEKYIKAINLLS